MDSGTVLISVAIHVAVELAVIVRVLLRPHRQPASRIAWIVVITTLPVMGILAYLLFGEVPDVWVVAGAAIIVTAISYLTHRESVAARAQRTASSESAPS